MARINLDRVMSTPDIISTEAYEFILGTIPNSVGNDERMVIKAINASLPGISNQSFEVAMHGFVRNFRGRKDYPRTLAVTYVEDKEFHTLRMLRNWHEFVVGTNSANSSGDNIDYTVNPDLVLYNGLGEEINRDTFYRLYPQDIPDVPVSGESSAAMQITCTFRYDYFESTSHTSS